MKMVEKTFFIQEMDVRYGIKDLRVQQPTRIETLASEGPTGIGQGEAQSNYSRNISNSKIFLWESLAGDQKASE